MLAEHPNQGLHRTEGLLVGLSETWLMDNLHADSQQIEAHEACHPIKIDVHS